MRGVQWRDKKFADTRDRLNLKIVCLESCTSICVWMASRKIWPRKRGWDVWVHMGALPVRDDSSGRIGHLHSSAIVAKGFRLPREIGEEFQAEVSSLDLKVVDSQPVQYDAITDSDFTSLVLGGEPIKAHEATKVLECIKDQMASYAAKRNVISLLHCPTLATRRTTRKLQWSTRFDAFNHHHLPVHLERIFHIMRQRRVRNNRSEVEFHQHGKKYLETVLQWGAEYQQRLVVKNMQYDEWQRELEGLKNELGEARRKLGEATVAKQAVELETRIGKFEREIVKLKEIVTSQLESDDYERRRELGRTGESDRLSYLGALARKFDRLGTENLLKEMFDEINRYDDRKLRAEVGMPPFNRIIEDSIK